MKRLIPMLAGLLLAAMPLTGQETAEVQRQPTLRFTDTMRARGLFAPVLSPAEWGPEKKLLKVGRNWMDALSGEPTPVPSSREKKTAPLVTAMATALQKAFEGKNVELPVDTPPYSRPSTVPRHPEPNPGVITAKKAPVALAVIANDLWSFRKDAGLKRLTTSGSPKRKVELAPDGLTASYIEEFNLYLVDTSTARKTALSQDGSENLFYGELDWVYQEEIWGRYEFKGTWWAPTGGNVAYLRIDEEGVPLYTVLHYLPTHPRKEHLKYPKAGDVNPRISLLVSPRDGSKAVSVDLEKYAGSEFLIVRVGWTPDGAQVLFQVQDREQTWLDLNVADPTTGKITTLIHEKSEAWVNILDGIHWLKGGDFIWESERTGYRHLYRYGRDGTLKGAITSGAWQVTSVDDIDQKRGEIVFEATKDGAINRNTYVIGLDGKGLRRLTPGDGCHTVSWNHDKTLYVDTFSSYGNPSTSRLYKRDGTLVRALDQGKLSRAADSQGFNQPQLVSIRARDGYALDAMLIKPSGFDEKRAHPVWVEGYFGPDSPTVRNRWHASTWHQFLAQQGMVVFSVNVRSASGRGQMHTATCYRQMGLPELQDLSDAVDWLTAHPWADGSRVGLTGYSYGGFMTAFALCKTKKFKLGIAGGGVYDWRNYDTMYTERYMRMPKNNKEGYDATSVLLAAGGLTGHLIIHHGTIDENVHMQNALQLVHALQSAGKGGPGESFELMLYPNNRHGFQERGAAIHSRRLAWNAIRSHLLAAQ